ncbi:hypothetical protein AB6G96_01580 [Staphylococcus haemolyticus]|uniref:hypothetical protein n=1 Tax=Staphylococcus TaxID=1279 RepID=UPI000758FF47|nr:MULTISPECIES: hypothetical protein [Staphylococcus]MBD3928070.1 hypothetical protein [Staphylococcus haemolyticus]MBF2215417.1 hypothetical protein [Staphylococcus haemolyticus]MBF2217828.1 hypothetical protein [Staphylococcus haemolyticus]MBF2220242.1 hypothetical protein [Staphylococcus haemolyticus]MBF2234534.1 hypothetical protein [Staphylococcus haemolyticus]
MNKFLKDSSLNIISNLIVVVVIQLIAFPLINKDVNNSQFALLIVLYGIAIVIATSLGNTLNNVRLLHREDISEIERETIFTRGFLIILVFNLIIFTGISIFYSHEFDINLILLILFSLLLTSRYYLNVYFRENLNYTHILLVNIFVFIGYLIGLLIFKFVLPLYSIVFLLGEILGFIFLYKKTKFLSYIKGSPIINKLKVKRILHDFVNFTLINVIINILNYLDRFILLPIIGPMLVNVYFIASTASKMIGLVTTPMNNVILSYLSVKDSKDNLKRFVQINIGIIIASIPMFFVVKYSSLLVVFVLYNTYISKVTSIINLVVIICILQIFNSIFHPFAMRMIHSKIIFFIQIGYGVIYIILAFIGSYIFGLQGFCWAAIISMLFKLIATNLIVLRITALKKGMN